jgi:hypothetical protein
MTRATSNSGRGKTQAVPAGTKNGPIAGAAMANSVTEAKPSSEQIRARAYQIYAERAAKGVPGDAASDWLKAESELTRR